MRHGKWEFYRVCTKCDGFLSKQTVYYGHGVCPECGYDDNSTICSYTKVIRRKVYKQPSARRVAIEAQKLREAGYFSMEFLRQTLATIMAKRKPRQFTWEYKVES
jgi:hypothetical protein